MISQGVFFILWNFHFSGCYWGKSTKNSPKWKVTIVTWMMTSLDMFFDFFKIWVFWVVRGWVGSKRAKKWPKMTKKFCLTLYLRNSIYFIWLWLFVHLCKTMISPALFFVFFHFFKILIFQISQRWSINTKKKLWSMTHLLHMCVWFFYNKFLIDYLHHL